MPLMEIRPTSEESTACGTIIQIVKKFEVAFNNAKTLPDVKKIGIELGTSYVDVMLTLQERIGEKRKNPDEVKTVKSALYRYTTTERFLNGIKGMKILTSEECKALGFPIDESTPKAQLETLKFSFLNDISYMRFSIYAIQRLTSKTIGEPELKQIETCASNIRALEFTS